MALVDEGNGKDLEFGHTDYYTGEGRGVTHRKNTKERYINPELSSKERDTISHRDGKRRNEYGLSLFCENHTQIMEHVRYNHLTEDLSLSWSVAGTNGKRIFDITRGKG